MASNQEIVDLRHVSDLASVIRSKYQRLKNAAANFQTRQEKFFKPLLSSSKSKTEEATTVRDSEPPTAAVEKKTSFSTREFKTFLNSADDKLFGVKKLGNAWYLGTFPVRFTPTSISVADREYPATEGLLSLLTRKNPQKYSSVDLENYVDLLRMTKSHLTKKGDMIRYRQGNKYQTIIKNSFPEYQKSSGKETSEPPPPLTTTTPENSYILANESIPKNWEVDDSGVFSANTSAKKEKEEEERDGEGVSTHISVGRKKRVIKPMKGAVRYQYVYYDSPDEIVRRLQILHASRVAGNLSVTNEILDIENELKEAGYIH